MSASRWPMALNDRASVGKYAPIFLTISSIFMVSLVAMSEIDCFLVVNPGAQFLIMSKNKCMFWLMEIVTYAHNLITSIINIFSKAVLLK